MQHKYEIIIQPNEKITFKKLLLLSEAAVL